MNKEPRIIGLSGTNGGGKDTAGHILQKYYGFLFVSVTDLLRDEAEKRAIEPDRENLRTISAEWRRESGLGVLVDKALAKYEGVKEQYAGGLIMASMRNPGEADRVHELGGVMMWVDADPRIRYDRVQANAASRGRAAEDQKTYKEFLAEQEAEMHQSGDEATLSIAGVKAKCDIFIDNNDPNLEVFRQQLEKTLGLESR
jgi:dephospho-CoA kinase